MKTCEWCEARGKTWDGDDPKCAFPDGQPFTSGNWNCATMSILRDLAERIAELEWDEQPPDASLCRIEDQTVLHLAIDPDLCHVEAYALWATWYKNRGRTEAVWLLSDSGVPRTPTESEVLEIVDYWKTVLPMVRDSSGERD